MSSTPQHLLEILKRVRAGKHLGGGDVPHAGLQADVNLLAALHLIDASGKALCLTDLGVAVLAAAPSTRRPLVFSRVGRGLATRR